jgi:hypothetical protein
MSSARIDSASLSSSVSSSLVLQGKGVADDCWKSLGLGQDHNAENTKS